MTLEDESHGNELQFSFKTKPAGNRGGIPKPGANNEVNQGLKLEVATKLMKA